MTDYLQIIYFYDRDRDRDRDMDVDNIVKPIQDALIGLVYTDDKQLIILVSKRSLLENLKIDNMTAALTKGFVGDKEIFCIAVASASRQEMLRLW